MRRKHAVGLGDDRVRSSRLPDSVSCACAAAACFWSNPGWSGLGGGRFQTRWPKGLYGGPLVLQREPFLPKVKLTARGGGDNRANAVIGWTVNLGIRRFWAPQIRYRSRPDGWTVRVELSVNERIPLQVLPQKMQGQSPRISM
jgi:hypothetical protein